MEISDLGVCWESLRPYEQKDLEACSPSRGSLNRGSMLRGLQKGYFQALPLPRRMTGPWARALQVPPGGLTPTPPASGPCLPCPSSALC